MKKVFAIIAIFLSLQSQAQLKQATLQASGLTCAMCSNAINKALQKLPFASKIESNIKESSFTVTFKQGSAVNFDAMRKAVEGAGFSVAKLEVKAAFNNVKVSNDAHVSMQGQNLHFLAVKDQTLNGERTFQLVDKKFVADKVYKKYAATTTMACVKTGTMAACCSNPKNTDSRIYHITI